LPPGRRGRVQPIDEPAGLGVGAARGALGPCEHAVDQHRLLGIERAKHGAGRGHRFEIAILESVVVGRVFFRAVDLAAEDGDVWADDGGLAGLAGAHRVGVLFECDAKRFRRGEQTLFEQLEHELGRERFGRVAGPLLAQLGVALEVAVHWRSSSVYSTSIASSSRLGKRGLPRSSGGQLALEPADHDRAELRLVGRDTAVEALVVE
jgi:hypothetical protein